jgi:hypothetical protein
MLNARDVVLGSDRGDSEVTAQVNGTTQLRS